MVLCRWPLPSWQTTWFNLWVSCTTPVKLLYLSQPACLSSWLYYSFAACVISHAEPSAKSATENLSPSLTEEHIYTQALAIFMRIEDKKDEVLHFMKKPRLTRESPQPHLSPIPPPLPLTPIQNASLQQPHTPASATPTSQLPRGLLDQPSATWTGLQVRYLVSYQVPNHHLQMPGLQ